MWVPVTVKDNDCVSRLQVEAQASGPGAEQEHKVLRGRVVECLQQHAAVLRLGGSYRGGGGIPNYYNRVTTKNLSRVFIYVDRKPAHRPNAGT